MTLQEIIAAGFRGRAKRLDDIDLPRIGSRIKVGEDELHAFLEVESRGSGFDDYNRPKILFEPHVFYKVLGPGPERDLAVRQGLAYPKWGTKKYPSDSYPRLIQACKINPRAAIRSCSWGMTQIMCDNYKMVGYTSPEAMVSAFMDDEENHVEACVNFLIAAGIDDDLRAHRWETVARVYNGPGYAKNQYHTKMKKAFEKWQKIPDTPYDNLRDYLVEKKDTGDPNAVFVVKTDDVTEEEAEEFIAPKGKKTKKGQFVESTLTEPEIRYIQTRLRNLGYVMVGKVDGKWKQGGSVTAAISSLQETCGLEPDGHYGPLTQEALNRTDGSNRYVVSDARKNTTTEDVRASGSRTIAATDSIKSTNKVAASGLGLLGAGNVVYTYAPDAISWISPVREFFSDVPVWAWIIIGLIVCFIMWKNADKVEKARVDDERTGKNAGHPDPAPSPPVSSIDSKADLPSRLPSFLRKTPEPGEPEVDVQVTR